MLVYTIKELCRTCYTCVRECPAKAIRIVGGQAEVIEERCIACGNCTKVCSQGAKVFLRVTDKVDRLLLSQRKAAAIIAPSFPAEFQELSDHRQLVGMVRALGFTYVAEVSFGADLIAAKYSEMLSASPDKTYISSDCPSIVNFVRFYHPNLAANLVPIVSPMIAMMKVMRKKYGAGLPVVFIGPCVAKKSESHDIEAALTFIELREMFEARGITKENTEPSEFDPPLGGRGAIFPVTRGLLQTAGINDDAITGNIIAAEGRIDFQEAIKELEAGMISQNLELLCCEGCIMGPGISKSGKQYNRRALVSKYAQSKMENFDQESWEKSIAEFSGLDFYIRHRPDDHRRILPSDDDLKEVLESMGKFTKKDHLDCGACGYETCIEHAAAIKHGLAEVEMCLPFTIEKLHKSVKDLALSNEKLTTMQLALKQSEKLAHMGQLSAGIAHELNNPLGVVIMYSNILLEEEGTDEAVKEDLKLIVEQAGRCKKIVAGLLNFARKNQVNYQTINARELVESSLSSLIIPENVTVKINDRTTNPNLMLDVEQMTQVITNMVRNSFDAMPGGGSIEINLEDSLGDVTFIISDTGSGIKQEDKAKVFEPFFTTKGIGHGTGLGLATAYGIVKMHKGQITVESNNNPEAGQTGTSFRIVLPRRKE
jgi:iron only hydrogenase large subunit-like protein/nitrogen-specific signal transduction histidine kinase